MKNIKDDLDNLYMFEKFTITCNKCKGKNISKEDSRDIFDGDWGELEYICNDCGNRETIAEAN